jgi:hypothetical protein
MGSLRCSLEMSLAVAIAQSVWTHTNTELRKPSATNQKAVALYQCPAVLYLTSSRSFKKTM